MRHLLFTGSSSSQFQSLLTWCSKAKPPCCSVHIMGTSLYIFGEQLKIQLSKYLFSTTVAAAGCLLIERSVVKSPAAAALKLVLGHDAKLLSKNVQLLPLVWLMRVCLTGRIKLHQKGMFLSISAASWSRICGSDVEMEEVLCDCFLRGF